MSDQHQQTLAVIAAFGLVRGYPPTVRDVAESMIPPMEEAEAACVCAELEDMGFKFQRTMRVVRVA